MTVSITELFDPAHTEHSEIFDGVRYPWEIIPLIQEYLEYAKDSFAIDASVDASHASYLGKNIAIGAGTIIEPGVVIHGPAIIGKNCRIRTGAYIRGNVIIGDNCIIGNSTEIKNSLLCNDVAAPHFNYIGDSVLGYKVHLGASVVISNLKTPPSEITVTTLEQTFKTGLQKFGAAIGDNTEIGAHAVLNPGTIIGQRSIVYPLTSIRGVIPSDTIVKLRQNLDTVMRHVR